MSIDQVSSLDDGDATGGGHGPVSGTLQGAASNVVNFSSTWLDRLFPPKKREEWKEWLTKFATEHPYVASFLASQIALSGLPVLLFAFMTLTVFIFALLTGILLGVLGALLFVLVTVGFALIILLPTLFFTTGAAVSIWLWGAGAYLIVKRFNKKEVAGGHPNAAGGKTLNGEKLDVKSALSAPPNGQQRISQAERGGKEGLSEAGSTAGAQHHAAGKDTTSYQQKSTTLLNSTGPESNYSQVADGVEGGATETAGV